MRPNAPGLSKVSRFKEGMNLGPVRKVFQQLFAKFVEKLRLSDDLLGSREVPSLYSKICLM